MLKFNRFYMAEAGDDGAAGGGVGSAGSAGAGSSGGAAGAGGSAGTGSNTTGTPDATVAALQAQIAALMAKDAEREAATKAAHESATAEAEARRVAALSESQKLQEALAKQQQEIDATKGHLVAERRSIALDKLGVADKFRSFAPAVDPSDPKGAKTLEDWAKANPELLTPANRTTTTSAIDQLKQAAGSALNQVIAGTRKSTLVTQRNLSKLQ